MNDLILIKTGALGDRDAMPKLNEGEPGYRTDTKELFIGTEDGNVRLCGAGDLAEAKAYADSKVSGVNALISANSSEITNIKTRLAKIEGDLATILARLDAMTTPGE